MPGIAARTKDLRLKGSDLYVVRLDSCNVTCPLPSQSSYNPSDLDHPLPTPSPKSEPSSLCDEFSPIYRTPDPPTNSSVKVPPPRSQPKIVTSRPCYRWVSAMHSVGIKNMSWTKVYGDWEDAKVRDLVEALEMGDGERSQDDCGVFVTNHEVHMLKRVLGF